MAQKVRVLEHVTSDATLRALMDELMDECHKVLGLWDQLVQEKRSGKKDALESQLYVALVGCEAKLASVLKEWDRVVDEELPDE